MSKRWRAEMGSVYWYICSDTLGVRLSIECNYDYRHQTENSRWEIGNYFSTKQQAAEYVNKIMDILKENV